MHPTRWIVYILIANRCASAISFETEIKDNYLVAHVHFVADLIIGRFLGNCDPLGCGCVCRLIVVTCPMDLSFKYLPFEGPYDCAKAPTV
jgi:hypothetical protein